MKRAKNKSSRNAIVNKVWTKQYGSQISIAVHWNFTVNKHNYLFIDTNQWQQHNQDAPATAVAR